MDLFDIYVSCLSCLSCCIVYSLQPCGHLLEKGWSHGSLICDIFLCVCHVPYGVLGQVWYLIVSIPDLCLLSYFQRIGRMRHTKTGVRSA